MLNIAFPICNYVMLDGVTDMSSIVRNQKVNPQKLEKAKEFRENMTALKKCSGNG